MPTIEWQNDFTRARQEYDSYIQQIQANPARVPVTFGGSGGAPSIPGTFGGGAGPGSTGPVIGAGSSSMTSGSVQAAGQQVAQALSSVANQIRAAGGVAPTLNGGGAIASPYPGTVAAQAAPGPLAPVPAAVGGWNQGNLNQLAAVNAAQQAGALTPGGAAGGGSSQRFGVGLSRLRGVLYGVGAEEGIRAARASAVGSARSQYAEGPDEALNATEGVVDSASSGIFGQGIGFALDLAGSAGLGTGPTQLKTRLIEQRASQRASAGARRDVLRAAQDYRTIAGGIGKYGSGQASIDNDYTGERQAISEQYENLPSDPITRAVRVAGLRARQGAAYATRAFRTANLDGDREEQQAGDQDSAAVARGELTRGAAGRRSIERRLNRETDIRDKQARQTELDTYDAEEGFRQYERTTAARGSRDQAYYQFKDQPHVAEAIGIYNRGAAEYERSKREGTPEEADLVRQRTQYELLGYQRQLIESGSAQFSEGFAVDTGQAGSTGLQSKKEGDDLAEVLNKLGELLAAVNAVNESLN